MIQAAYAGAPAGQVQRGSQPIDVRVQVAGASRADPAALAALPVAGGIPLGELAALSEKARNGKLSLDEMQGGSFTITNLGGIGGTSFTPIVNWPEVAILGISRGGYEPIYNGQNFEPRLMLPLSLSYDHRVIDGADGARFLRWIADAFEQPFVLAL